MESGLTTHQLSEELDQKMGSRHAGRMYRTDQRKESGRGYQ